MSRDPDRLPAITGVLLGALALAGALACAGRPLPGDEGRAAGRSRALPPHAADALGTWMTGTFSSAVQAMADPEAYFDVRLVVVPIWTERSDGPWLYVEQAVAAALARPYRQRVYHLVTERDAVRSDVHLLPGNPLDHAAAWQAAAPLGALTPAELVPRTGCSIRLRRDGPERWVGATEAGTCRSSLRGASWAGSEVSVTPTRLESWDRGFDADGIQVWGATGGPYVFDKLAPGPPPR